MILRHHIELVRHLSNSTDISAFLENYKGLEKLKITQSIKKDYPIKSGSIVPNYINNTFKVHISIDSLVFGQFIMLEQIITGKTKLPEYKIDLEILKLILRPTHHEVFDNENTKDEENNQELILNTETKDLYSVLNLFLENRNKSLFEDYAGVFYDSKDGIDEESEEPATEPENNFHQQWYWYSIVRMLGQEDVRRYSDIYMLPMTSVLPEMSYIAQRNKLEDAKRRQSEALRKL